MNGTECYCSWFFVARVLRQPSKNLEQTESKTHVSKYDILDGLIDELRRASTLMDKL
ncbi:MAG: hypothetical protein WCL18_08155 [bacterium]